MNCIDKKLKSKFFIGLIIFFVYGVTLIYCFQFYTEPYKIEITTDRKDIVINEGGKDIPMMVNIKNNTSDILGSSKNIFCSYRIYDVNNNLISEGSRFEFSDIKKRHSQDVNIVIEAPLWVGEYVVRIDLVQEGVAWFEDYGKEVVCEVKLNVQENYSSDIAAELFCTTELVQDLGQNVYIPLWIKNTGENTIKKSGQTAVVVSYHIKNENNEIILFEGARIPLLTDILPNDRQEIICEINLEQISLPVGKYSIIMELLQEGITWGCDIGIVPVEIEIERY